MGKINTGKILRIEKIINKIWFFLRTFSNWIFWVLPQINATIFSHHLKVSVLPGYINRKGNKKNMFWRFMKITVLEKIEKLTIDLRMFVMCSTWLNFCDGYSQIVAAWTIWVTESRH